MKNLIVIAATLISTSVLADGFRCETKDGLKIKVYNQTNPAMGTRNPAVMVLSDRDVATSGLKTVAVLEAPKTLTSAEGTQYVGRVDLRFKNSNRKGEYLLGTRLGYIKTITLDVDFSFANPVAFGSQVNALVKVAKRNGKKYSVDATCERYLKN